MLVVLGLPIVVIISGVLTVISPIVRIIPSMQCSHGASAAHPTSGTAVSEWDYALGLHEADQVGVGASVMSVVASFAVVTVGTSRTIPNGVGGMELLAKAATMGEWKGSSGAASWHLFVMVLGHGVPSETVVPSVFDRGGYGYPTGVHFFWPVVVGDKGAVIKVWMDT